MAFFIDLIDLNETGVFINYLVR